MITLGLLHQVVDVDSLHYQAQGLGHTAADQNLAALDRVRQAGVTWPDLRVSFVAEYATHLANRLRAPADAPNALLRRYLATCSVEELLDLIVEMARAGVQPPQIDTWLDRLAVVARQGVHILAAQPVKPQRTGGVLLGLSITVKS